MKLPIDADILRRVAEAPPIPEPHLGQVIDIWMSAIRANEASKKAASCRNS